MKIVLRAAAALAAITAAAIPAFAQRPQGTSICDFYTTAALKDNTEANQLTLLTVIVNTVVIGSYHPLADKSVPVAGILAPEGGLLPYFSGALMSTNRKNAPAYVNFLDGGGAAPLLKDMPANSTSSNQYLLLTHLYAFFGHLTGCSKIGGNTFRAYEGDPDMYSVHKFMQLNDTQVGFFVAQVGQTLRSFGVASEDVSAVTKALNMLFGYRCSPKVEIIPKTGNYSQSICTTASCPLDPNAVYCPVDPLAQLTSCPANATSSLPPPYPIYCPNGEDRECGKGKCYYCGATNLCGQPDYETIKGACELGFKRLTDPTWRKPMDPSAMSY